MHDTPKNTIEFRVWGRFAMFTDPLTRVGGEKCSYHVPTYEALKGIAKSIYWKPTLIWVVDAVRVMKRIRTQTKGTKPLNYGGGNSLAIYTFLTGDPDLSTGLPSVEYQVRAHFEWNDHRPELKKDQIDGKHFQIAKRSLALGGRQDIFLGTRDCQGYVEPCEFASGTGDYDGKGELGFGLMFHSFDYPDETGVNKLAANFWRPTMTDGVIHFPRSEQCPFRKEIREMTPKRFGMGQNLRDVDAEALEV
ncbi:MAG: type I-C CRISPR-associated protein Cas5c [Bryobacteraceae bacterium]